MPQARRKTTRKQPQRRSAAKAGDATLNRLNSSLDAAYDALTELRKNLGRGGREVVKDVHQRITDVRKDARKLNKSLRSELQKSIAGARPSPTRTTTSAGRKAPAGRRATAARKPASSRRTTAGRSTAKRSTTTARSRRSTASRKS
jgi:hypothetical protein